VRPKPARGDGVAVSDPDGVVDGVPDVDGVVVGEPDCEGVTDGDCVDVSVPSVWDADDDGVTEEVPVVDAVCVDVAEREAVAVLVGVDEGVLVFVGVDDCVAVFVLVDEDVRVGVGEADHGTAARPRNAVPAGAVAMAAPPLLYISVAGLNEYTDGPVETKTTSPGGDTATAMSDAMLVKIWNDHSEPVGATKLPTVRPVPPESHTRVLDSTSRSVHAVPEPDRMSGSKMAVGMSAVLYRLEFSTLMSVVPQTMKSWLLNARIFRPSLSAACVGPGAHRECDCE